MICVFARADADAPCLYCGKPRLLAGRPIYRNCEKCIYLGESTREVRVSGCGGRSMYAMSHVCELSQRALVSVPKRCLPEYSGNAAWFDTPESALYSLCRSCQHRTLRRDDA